jgi:N-acetylneuraminic acid mutarotase
MRRGLVPLALAVLVGACTSFEDSEPARAPDGGADASSDAGGGTPDPDAGADAPAPRAAKHVYVFGGVADATGEQSTKAAYRAPIEADGSLGTWEAFAALDVARDNGALAVTGAGVAVFAGGHLGSGSARVPHVESVDTVSLEPMTSWSAGPTLPGGRSSSAAVAIGSRVYVTGGQAPAFAFHDEIWMASVESGTLSSWAPAGTLPAPMATHAMVALGTRVYVVGGGAELDGGIAYAPVAAMATVEADGALGGWKESGTMPVLVNGPAAVTVGLRVFVLGGGASPDAHPTGAVSVGTQAEDGTLAWAAGAPMPGPAWLPCAVATSDTVYVIGGYSAVGEPAQASVYVGRVASNGGIAWTTSAPMPVARAAAGCAVR